MTHQCMRQLSERLVSPATQHFLVRMQVLSTLSLLYLHPVLTLASVFPAMEQKIWHDRNEDRYLIAACCICMKLSSGTLQISLKGTLYQMLVQQVMVKQSVNCTRVIVDSTTLCPHSSTVTITSAAMPKHGGFVVFLCLSTVSCCNHHKSNNTPL